MIHVYTARHAAPAPRAPQSLSTVVSPGDAPVETVVAAIQAVRPHPPIDGALKRWPLLYPEMPSEPVAAMERVTTEYRNCARCHLCDRRDRIAFLKGNPYAAVMILGESPGQDENRQGVPFIGPSGRLQDELLREAGLDPIRDVAWTNITGCRACDNRFTEDRKPTVVESVACSERLLMTLRAIRPRIVLCVGASAASAFFTEDDTPPMNTFVQLAPPVGESIIVGIFRHPAYLLRIGQQPNMYGEWAAARLALRQLKVWLPTTKVATWGFGLRYVSDLRETMGGI